MRGSDAMAEGVAAAVAALSEALQSHKRLAGDSVYIAHHGSQIDACEISMVAIRDRLTHVERCVAAADQARGVRLLA